MKKIMNPHLVNTSRRGMLRGTALAGAAALVGGAAGATPRRLPVPGSRLPNANILKAEAATVAKAAPADLTGYERVKMELVAPPSRPSTTRSPPALRRSSRSPWRPPKSGWSWTMTLAPKSGR